MNTPSSILALDQLPFDVVYKLACSANAVAARHVKPVRRTLFLVKRAGLMGCDVCHRTWVAPTEPPKHADFCPVGHTQKIAQEIIRLHSQPLPEHFAVPASSVGHLESSAPLLSLEDHPLPGEEKCAEVFGIRGHELTCTLRKGHPVVRNIFGHWNASLGVQYLPSREPGLRITEVPAVSSSHERSDGTVEAGRAAGEPSGNATLPAAADYCEPWAYNPELRQVRDKHGFLVADFLEGTDLTVEEKERVGERIVACVNFLAGNSTEWLRDARLKIAGSTGEREESDGIVLDLGVYGWFVEEKGQQLPFPDYGGAKHYFNTRVLMAKEAGRAARHCMEPTRNGVRA